MSRESTLIDNNILIDSDEYDYWCYKMLKVEEFINLIKYRGINFFRFDELLKRLEEFKTNGFNFTIGRVNYKDLIDFLECTYSFFSDRFIQKCFEKYLFSTEINPVSYGYDNLDFKSFVKGRELIRLDIERG